MTKADLDKTTFSVFLGSFEESQNVEGFPPCRGTILTAGTSWAGSQKVVSQIRASWVGRAKTGGGEWVRAENVEFPKNLPQVSTVLANLPIFPYRSQKKGSSLWRID